MKNFLLLQKFVWINKKTRQDYVKSEDVANNKSRLFPENQQFLHQTVNPVFFGVYSV